MGTFLSRYSELSGNELSDLLSQIERQDQSAFSRLFHAYYGRVANFLRTRLHGQDDAIQSIANETLYEVWRKPGAYNGTSLFSTFLIGIAKNKLLQHWGKVDSNLVLSEDIEQETDAEDVDAPYVETTPSPFEGLMQQEKLNVLLECADQRLNLLQRTVLIQRLLYGYKIEELAQTLERNAATLRGAFQIAYDKVMKCVRLRLGIAATNGDQS